MDRRPSQSLLKCIGDECSNKPTVVLIGQHKRPEYQIQVMSCEADLPQARRYAQREFKGIHFTEVVSPSWLISAQKRESKQGDSS